MFPISAERTWRMLAAPDADQPGDEIGVPLCEACGQQAAHRMADDHEGQRRVLVRGDVGHGSQVADHVLEIGDQGPLAIAVAVSDVVGGVHHRALLDEDACEVSVAGAVLGVAAATSTRRRGGSAGCQTS